MDIFVSEAEHAEPKTQERVFGKRSFDRSLGLQNFRYLSGSETVDRLSIIVSGKGIEKLFFVPKLQSGTGETIASAFNEILESWGLPSK